MVEQLTKHQTRFRHLQMQRHTRDNFTGNARMFKLVSARVVVRQFCHPTQPSSYREGGAGLEQDSSGL